MKLSKELLQQVATKGSEEVSRVFSKLSKEEVTVETSVAEVVSYNFIVDELNVIDKHTIITYAQVIGGVDGVALLSLPREAALSLVDVLNQQEVGTTGILLDVDRSAVKETLNILSNSFLNFLAKSANINLMFGEPYMMTVNNISNVVEHLKGKNVDEADSVLDFKTTLNIAKHKIKAQLFILFNKSLAESIKSFNK